MRLKKKTFVMSIDPRQRAGDEAEKQMAFYLDRRFKDKDNVFLMHDIRIEHGSHTFQIDHLLVTRYGISLVESKSIHTKVSITRHDDRREHWTREFNGKEEGIPSPVRQVQEQARLLQAFLIENREKILGKFLFGIQKGYKFCPFDTYVGVSTSAVFHLAEGTPLPEHVYKADEVAPEIDRVLAQRVKSDTLLTLNPLAELPWEMSIEEARKTAEFLFEHDTPLASKATAPERAVSQPKPQVTAIPKAPIARPVATVQPTQSGDMCPQCGTRKVALAMGGPVKVDGSREKFLACVGNRDKSCTWKMPYVEQAPLLAVVPQSTKVAPAPIAAKPTETSVPPHGPTPAIGTPRYCFDCHVSIPEIVAKFCWNRTERFGGRAYCRTCQAKHPASAARQ